MQIPMMKRRRIKKNIAIILTACMIFPWFSGSALAEDTIEAPSDLMTMEAVSGSAITYYVGGGSPSDDNAGTSGEVPFATLAKAASVINSKAAGSYNIIVQGNTIETQNITIGDGTKAINVAVRAATGSAIIKRAFACTGNLITVENQASLILGDSTNSGTADLTIHGGSTWLNQTRGAIISINSGGFLSIYTKTILEHNLTTTTDYSGLGGAVRNSGTFHMYGGLIRNNFADFGGGVYNTGTFELHGGTIEANNVHSGGGGVFNELGTFLMYGGAINGNIAEGNGGVCNKGIFQMYGGSIDGNIADANGGVNNLGNFQMYAGTISGNTARLFAGVSTEGMFQMVGGTISNNHATETMGGVTINANATFAMTGGTIEGNTAPTGGGVYIYKNGTLTMTGGTIKNNSASDKGGGVYNDGNFYFSGNAAIPAGDTKENDVFLVKPIILNAPLTGTDKITISLPYYCEGEQLLQGTAELIAGHYSNFILTNDLYVFNQEGKIHYLGTPLVFYVNKAGSDVGNGSANMPFATIQRAVEEIDGGMGEIILQSDMILTKPIVINAAITLLSNGNICTITRSDTFEECEEDIDHDDNAMVVVQGMLTLGESNNSGSDATPTLIFDGGSVNGILIEEPLINNLGVLNLNSGVALQNSKSEDEFSGILNQGKFNMRGGLIRNITAGYISGVYSTFETEFNMSGGMITGNNGFIAGVYVYGSNFNMSGGTITGNNGECSGVFIAYSSFVMSGGNINSNRAVYLAGVRAEGSGIEMSGGSIDNNISENALGGVALYSGMMMDDESIIGMDMDVPQSTFFNMSGGSICGNTGLSSGVFASEDTSFSMSGGKIGGNTGIMAGVLAIGETAVRISGNALIENDNQILLDNGVKPSKITISGPMSGQTPAIAVVLGNFNTSLSAKTFIPEFPIGRQIFVSESGYTFTPQDTDKFTLTDSIYGINIQGKLGKVIKDSGVAIANNVAIYYSGNNKTVDIAVMDGLTSLVKDVDYVLNFSNNINAGLAVATVRGIGDYAGMVTNTFNIYKRSALSIITSAPADMTFSAKEHKTMQELQTAISLSLVAVQTDAGIYTLPISWSLTGGTYDPKGGTYQFTGSVIGNDNISSGGLTLSTKIIVTPIELLGEQIISIGEGNNDISAVISHLIEENSLNVTVELQTIDPLGMDGNITIPVVNDRILSQISNDEVTRVNITVTIPDALLNNDNPNRTDIHLDSNLLEELKKEGKDATILVKDETGRERYSWTFSGEELNSSDKELTDVNLSLSVTNLTDNDRIQLQGENVDAGQGMVVNFGHEGVLPGQATVRIYVGDREGITAGEKIYLYHYNPDSGKLETLPYSSSYVVDKDGYITINLLHCSDYVILKEKADKNIITSLLNQIKVTPGKMTIYVGRTKGHTTQVAIKLPITLEMVDSLEEKTSQSAAGWAMITYRAGNSKVVMIDKDGKITAKGVGKVNIFTTVTLYSGKTKTFITTITVKKK